MADALFQMCRKVYWKKSFELLRFRGFAPANNLFLDRSGSVRYNSCISSLATLKIQALQERTSKLANFGPRDQHFLACHKFVINFGSFWGNRKDWKAMYSKAPTFEFGGKVDGSDDDDNSVDGDIKAPKLKNNSARRKALNGKYSAKVQKASKSFMRPSRYAFVELGEEKEDLLWVKRPKDNSASKRKVGWYAKQMAHLVSEGQVDKAQELFNSMRQEKIRPTTEIFNMLVAGYGKTGKIRKAFHHYNNIKKMSLQPTAHTYTSLFTICSQISSPSLSLSNLLKFWEEFQQGLQNAEITPDLITYNAAMKAAASCKSLAMALDIYEDMCSSNLQPDCRTYSSLLGACAGEGDSEKLSWVLKEMKEQNVKPDLFVFNALLRTIRDFRSQVQNAKENEETSAMEKLTSLDKETESTAKTCHIAKLNSNSNSTLSMDDEKHFNMGDSESDKDDSTIFTGTEDFLQTMAVNEVLPDIRTFHLLLQLAGIGVDEEEYIIHLMQEWDIKPDLPVLNALVKRRALLGDMRKAQAYMKMFEEEFEVHPTKTTYQSLARGCRKRVDGMWLLKEMKDRGFAPDTSVYCKMIKNASNRQDFQFLTELMKEMKKAHVQPTADILQLLDDIANKPDKQSLKKEKPLTRQEKRLQFMRKQQLGFYGFYKTWKHEMEQIELNETERQENNIRIDENEEEEISYDHL